MSKVPPLHPTVVAQFTRAFGPPNRTEGSNVQWSERPDGGAMLVNVLVNIGNDHPAVWVFDPNDPNQGVTTVMITEEQQIAPLIASILESIRVAGRKV